MPRAWALLSGLILVVAGAAPARAQTLATLPDLGLMDVQGRVSAVAVQADGKVVIGGDFTLVNGVRRNNIARLNADGTLDAAWKPEADLEVTDLAVAGTTIYAAGAFGTIGGKARHFLAALDGTTGNATAWDPNPDLAVNAIVAAGGVIYVGGGFSVIGGATRRQIAALDAATGTATAWDPNATLVASNTVVRAVAVAGSTVYVGGTFTVIGGQARSKLAALDATTGAATAWSPNPTAGASPAVVNELAVLGSTVYVAGSFTSIGGEARLNLAALDTASGDATGWHPGPAPAGAAIFALAADGGSVYVGGAFSTVGGQARSFLAALDAATGNATAWNPSPNGDVRALAVASGAVHVGGAFSTIAGETALMFARLDAATGSHVAGFRPAAGFTGGVRALAEQSDGTIAVAGDFRWAGRAGVARRGLLRVNADDTLDLGWNPTPNGTVLALAAAGTTVYAGGNFTTIGGATRSHVAALDGVTGNATAWDPNADQPVTALKLAGAILYVGGGFTTIGGEARPNLAALDAGTGAATAWAPVLNGSVGALALTDGAVYAAGGFTVAGGELRFGLAAFDAASADVTSWDPQANGAVTALEAAAATIYAGGVFTTIGGAPRARIAALDATTGAATAWNPSADGAVSTLLVHGGTVYAGGAFDSIGGDVRHRVAALDPALGSVTTWNPNAGGAGFVAGARVETQLRSGSTLYVGGFFSRIRNHDRDGLAALTLSAGGGRAVGFAPAHLDLGDQEVGTTGPAEPIALVNYGPGIVTIASIVAGGEVAQTNDCGATLAPGARCTIDVALAPSAVGPRAGSVTVTTDAAASPHVATLAGIGTQAGQLCCELSPEGCFPTVHTTTSTSGSTFVTRVDLPPPTPTATGPSVLVAEIVDRVRVTVTRGLSFGPATILVGEDQEQVCFVDWGDVHVNVHTHTARFVDQLFQPTEVPPLDHFLCYRSAAAKAPKGTAPYPRFAPRTVTALDRFATGAPGDQHLRDVKKVLVVCNPADKNGEDATAPGHAAHLEGYAVKIAKTKPAQPKPVKSVRAIANQLGELQLQIAAPDRLLVPSAQALGDGGVPPLAASTVDHFQCYRAKVAKAPKGAAPFPVFTRTAVTLTDQFGGPLTFDLKKPTRLCAPADKNGEDPDAPSHADHLVCYQAKLAKQKPAQPKLTARVVSTANQFGAEVLRARAVEELCVPSLAAD